MLTLGATTPAPRRSPPSCTGSALDQGRAEEGVGDRRCRSLHGSPTTHLAGILLFCILFSGYQSMSQQRSRSIMSLSMGENWTAASLATPPGTLPRNIASTGSMGSRSAAGLDSSVATNSTANERTEKYPIHFRSKKYPGSGFSPEFWKDVTNSGAVAPASENSGHGPSAVFETRPDRWRDNQYVRDDGILPWQMCSTDSHDYRPRVSLGGVGWRKREMGFIVLAASVWGESDETGKPTSVSNVSLLIYYQEWQKKCEKMPRNPHQHCLLSPRGSEFVFDCKVGQEPWQRAKRIVRKGSNGQPFWSTDPEISTDTLYCGVENGADTSMLQNRFNVQLRVFESESSNSPITKETIDVDVCYSQVKQTWPVAICTQPMNGFKQGSKFWYGNAASQVMGANATKHSLLDEFVVIHAMQGAKVNVHDFDGSLAAPMRKYDGNPSVSYRPGWSLPDMYSGNGEQQSVIYETHAETACMWEHRIRAKWVQIIHSADNMALPISPNKTMAQVADSLDTQAVSGVLVPTCLGNSPSSYRAPPLVSPHRYPFLGRYFRKRRFTPLGDPRAYDATNVHVFRSPRPNHRGEHGASYAIGKMHYRVVHMMGMTRNTFDSHAGWDDVGWRELGDKLVQALKTVAGNDRNDSDAQ